MNTTKRGVIVGVIALVMGLLIVVGMYLSEDRSGTGSEKSPDSAGSGVPAERQAVEPAENSEPEGVSAAASVSTADAGTDPALQEEAASYVSELAQSSGEPVRMDQAETFVGAEQPLTAAAMKEAPAGESAPSETAAVDAMETAGALREGGSANTPPPSETDAAAVDTMETAHELPEGGSADTPPPSGTDSVAEQAQLVAETGETPSESPAAEQSGKTAPQAQSGTAADAVEVDLPLTEEAPVTIAELLGPQEDIPPDAVYYVHTVKPGNDQGIWGIVHTGIIDNFAHGVAVHRGQSDETYRVDIPRDADERRADESSSFLGKFIYDKSRQSYVYNFKTERLGQNPDLIFPGQEIVIISFTPEELIAVYKHFVQQQEGDS